MKTFTVVSIHRTVNSRHEICGTLPELIQAYNSVLEGGKSLEHAKGKKKINCKPKTIKSLILNLNNAVNNSAVMDGLAMKRYELVVDK